MNWIQDCGFSKKQLENAQQVLEKAKAQNRPVRVVKQGVSLAESQSRMKGVAIKRKK